MQIAAGRDISASGIGGIGINAGRHRPRPDAEQQGEQIAEHVAADIASSTPKAPALPSSGSLPGTGSNVGEAVADQAGKLAKRVADKISKDLVVAAQSAPAPRPLDELLPGGKVPHVKNNEFDHWFDDLSSEELDILWDIPAVKKVIEDRIRRPGELHEWSMVCRAPQFKEWGVSMAEIKRFRTSTKDLKWINPHTGLPGGHNGNKHGSGTFHNELKNIIDNSKSLEEFNAEVIKLRDYWQIGPSLLPPLPTTK